MRLKHPTVHSGFTASWASGSTTSPDWTFDLKDFAYEHIGLSRDYEGDAQIARKLQPASTELEERRLPGAADRTAAVHPQGSELVDSPGTEGPHPARELPTAEPAAEAVPPLVAELIRRGVTRSTAFELVQQHPERIASKLDMLDWLTEKGDKRSVKNPAGWLVKSIRRLPSPQRFRGQGRA